MNNFISSFRKFFQLLELHSKDVFQVYFFALVSGVLNLLVPVGIQAIINFISTGRVTVSWVVLMTILIIVIALIGISKIMQLAILEKLQQKIFVNFALKFSEKIPKIKLENLSKTYLPELVNRFFDTLTVQKGLSKILLDFFTATLQILLGLLLLAI